MKVNLKPLEQQTMVITGASSGIGLTTARMAARKGARLVLAARSDATLEQIVTEIENNGGHAMAVPADVSNEDEVRNIAATANARFGGFDTWINNAGVSAYGLLMDVPLEDQRRIFETNYWGVVNGSLTALEHLKNRGGAIINIGSTLSDRAIPLQGAYSASKHAVKGFTESLRMEIEEQELPISVTLIKPGAIATPYTEHAKNYLEVEPQHPAPVYAPEVVAEAILHSAEHPVRDLFVGGAGKFISAMGQYAPRIADKAMEWYAFNSQKSGRPARERETNSLHKASGDPRERGHYEGHIAESSLYTKASMHPLVTGGIILAGAGLAYAATRRRASNGAT